MDNKAFAKGIAKISLIVFVLFLVGFFAVNYVIPVLAVHETTATISPSWLKANTFYVFQINLTNAAGSGDYISELRIYNTTEPWDPSKPIYNQFSCYPDNASINPWDLDYSKLFGVVYCHFADNLPSPQGTIGPGEYKLFYTIATTNDVETCIKWTLEPRDTNYGWNLTYAAYTCVDKTPPETKKTYGTPTKVVDGYRWVTSDTPITLTAIDKGPTYPPTGQVGAGVDKIQYRVTQLDVLDKDCTETCLYEGSEGSGVWQESSTNTTFTIPKDSCHLIEYYANDTLGNTEPTHKQCVFVDNKPPVTTKTIGDPKLTQDIEKLGSSNAEWSTEQAYTGTYSAKLITPNGAGGQDFAGIDSFFDVFVDLNSITNLSYYRKVTQYTTNGWSPIIILGIDANNNGIFEADPLAWESTFNVSYLGGDSFIQCEATNGLGSTDGSFVYVDAFNNFKCYTPKTDGSGFYWDVYEPLSYYQTHSVGIVDPTDKVTMVKVEIGGSTNFNNEIAYVDQVEMNGKIIIDEPLWWIGGNTPITLTCNDPGPHPVDQVTIWWRYSVDGGEPTTWKNYTETGPIIFPEESKHKLEYYCVDHLGNSEQHHFQTYIVDATPPVITKTIGEPKVWNETEKVWYIRDHVTPITYTAEDTGKHRSNDVQCKWWYWFNGIWYGSGFTNQPIIFGEDSLHKLAIKCWDALGNVAWDNETFQVDSTPPVTTKTYSIPFYTNGTSDWINSSTPITLTATDNKVGVLIIKYRYCLKPNCYKETCPCDCSGVDWITVSDDEVTFTIPGDSEHCIEYYAVDKLGNTEPTHKQCVFVDNTPPTGTKEVGEPKKVDTGFTWVTQNTPITLSCTDQGEHPVNNERVWWRISYDGSWGPWYSAPSPVITNFKDDTNHDLEFYCVDALGNKEETHPVQYYKVDTTPPETTKEIIGPQFYNETEEKLYINGITNISLTCVDREEPCAVGVDNIQYRYWVDEVWTDWFVYTEPFNFPEESNHTLEYYCNDTLGNKGDYHLQVYYVDKTPPETTKWFEGPFYSPNNNQTMWISNQTLVHLQATDGDEEHASGVNKTYWRNTLVDKVYCHNQTICQQAQGNGTWNLYTGPFNKSEESCHLIEYFSVDNVGKTENVKKQCVYVDNTPPTPDKKIGEPKAKWDGKDANFYPEIKDLCWNGQADEIECWKITLLTPIKLDCVDPEPHPVNHEGVCFRVEWDGEDQTKEYCDTRKGNMTEGFCCVNEEIEFMFNKISEHELEYYCVDALGNSNKKNLDIEKFKVEETKFEIQINKKWNLISVPVALLDDSVKEIFGNESDTVESVWTYDGDKWYVYTPDGIDNDDLHTMKPGWGYWVKALKSDTLIIGGSLMSPGKTNMPSKPVVKGWNLIGYYGADGMEGYYGPEGKGGQAYCELYSLGEDMWDKEFTSLWTYWELDNPNQWKPLNEGNNMDPGAGYWLVVPQEGLYTPSTTCGPWW